MTADKSLQELDVQAKEREEISHILKHYVPLYEVWAFGSRVKGTAKPYSDLDLVVISQQILSLGELANLKDAFDESDLPYKVDVVDWAASSELFRKIIAEHKVVVQIGSTGRVPGDKGESPLSPRSLVLR